MITDPYLKTSSGKLMPKTRGDIVTLSSEADCDLGRVVNSPFIIKGPGEYEIKGVFISGIVSQERTAYLYRIDGLRICYLSAAERLTEKQTEQLNGIDILMVPASKKAMAMIEPLEPKIIIPMNSTSEFLKESGWGKGKIKPVDKLTVGPSSLPEEREVIWLKK